MHYVDLVIKNFLRTNQPEDRGSYIRLDQNENPDGLPKWLFDEAMKKITPEYLSLYPEEIKFTTKYAKLLGLEKVTDIVEGGGETGHDSTRNGIFRLKDRLGEDDYIIIHDAARPILPQAAIDDMLRVAREKGNASLAIPCYETVIYTDNGTDGSSQLDRSKIMRIQTPQAYRFGSILKLYERAEAENKHDFIYADLVLIHYGERVYFSKGFTNNIKITQTSTRESVPQCAET